MRRFLIGISLLAVCQVGKSSPDAPSQPAPMAVGINLDGFPSWATAWPTGNLIDHLPAFTAKTTDSDGWPIPPSIPAVQVMGAGSDDPFPAGTYKLSGKGKGSVWLLLVYADGQPADWARLKLDGSGTPQDVTVARPLATYQVWIAESATPPDHVHALDLRPPGVPVGVPWDPAYLDLVRPFTGPLRVMDWMGANNDPPIVHWSDRNTSFSNAGPAGARLELIWSLCNTLGKPPWLCIPDSADDDYVQQLARQVKDQLRPDLTVYLEYSNEVWNNAKPQFARTQKRGLDAGLGPDPTLAGRRWYGRRAGQVFARFAAELPGRKVVRVISGFAPIPDVAANAIDQLKADGASFDALAFAPYFFNLDYPEDRILVELDAARAAAKAQYDGDIKNGKTPAEAQARADSLVEQAGIKAVTAILDSSGRCIDGWVADCTKAHKALADRYGVPLLCYEGGQGLSPQVWNQNNAPLVAAYVAANGDARMGGLYTRYLDKLQAGGVATFCHLSLCGSWTKAGCWGLRRRIGEDTAKHKAVRDWLAGSAVPVPGPITPASPATLDLISASRASHAALEAARKAAAELEAKVLAADRAVAGDLQQNGAYVDTSTTPPTVYSADPSQPAGFRAEPVRVGPSKDTRGPQDALPPARRRARRAA
jgi:hypothetical protein